MTKPLNIINSSLGKRGLFIFEALLIIGLATAPLFANFPYRINIFLAWEGTYRLFLGQIPFKDFGMPLGYGFWLIPALFFKLFGPYLFTLIKAQAFINIVAGFTFDNILRTLKVRPGVIFLSVLIFCISYSFVNFWPWYNHMVFIYQLLSINFLLIGFFKTKQNKLSYCYLFLSSLFIFLSIFTKQDGGGLAFMVNLFLVVYLGFVNKHFKFVLFYFLSFFIVTAIALIPLMQYDFLYWFNYGQEPHSTRTILMDFLNNIFLRSQWIKFYYLLILLIILSYGNIKGFFYDKFKFTFTLLVIGVLFQALLVQTTSYIPYNVNIYFHSFALAYIFSFFGYHIRYKLESNIIIALIFLGIIFWWSADYWNYGNRIITRAFPSLVANEEGDGVTINTWMITKDTVKTSREDWIMSDLKSFQHIYMPPETVEGIEYVMSLPVTQNNPTLKFLNLSELTPLSYEIGYDLETGPQIPLWYHQDVAIFEKQIMDYCEKIEKHYYDVVLFESINYLNNFYPKAIRECLQEHYNLSKKFLAPREIQNSYIEVYLLPKENTIKDNRGNQASALDSNRQY